MFNPGFSSVLVHVMVVEKLVLENVVKNTLVDSLFVGRIPSFIKVLDFYYFGLFELFRKVFCGKIEIR